MSLDLSPLNMIRQCINESYQQFLDSDHQNYSDEDAEALGKCYKDMLDDLPGTLKAALNQQEHTDTNFSFLKQQQQARD